jgi:hypothetical protein
VAVLVLGIVGLVLVCGYGVGLIPAIVALALAPGARREIAQSNGQMGGESFVKAGAICSWITVGLFAAGLVIVIAIIAIAVVTSSEVDTTTTTGIVSSSMTLWRP